MASARPVYKISCWVMGLIVGYDVIAAVEKNAGKKSLWY